MVLHDQHQTNEQTNRSHICDFCVSFTMCWAGWMDGWTDGRMDGWMDGWTEGRKDGWMDGWMDWANWQAISLWPHVAPLWTVADTDGGGVTHLDAALQACTDSLTRPANRTFNIHLHSVWQSRETTLLHRILISLKPHSCLLFSVSPLLHLLILCFSQLESSTTEPSNSVKLLTVNGLKLETNWDFRDF